MAEIDPNIALQARPLQLDNPLDTMSKALSLKQMSQQTQVQQRQMDDDAAMRQALQRNITTDDNGRPKVDQQAVMSDLMKTNPQQAINYKKVIDQSNYDELKKHTEMAGELAAGMQTPEGYAYGIKKGIELGLPNWNKLDPNFNPQQTQALMLHTQNAKDQFDQMDKSRSYDQTVRENDRKDKEFQIEKYKAFGGAPPSFSPGGSGATAPAGGGPASNDPAELVRFHVPPAQQQKAFDEIKAAQNTASNSKDILASFDAAAAGKNAVDLVPGMLNGDQKKLHALLGPTFQDVEGTVRQAAMDNLFNNATPQAWDSADTIAKKRAALVGYMQSKSSAPTAKGFGIDLSKYASTTMQDPNASDDQKTMQAGAAPVPPALQPNSKFVTERAVKWGQPADVAAQILQLRHQRSQSAGNN